MESTACYLFPTRLEFNASRLKLVEERCTQQSLIINNYDTSK